jgi:ribonuclease HI
MKKIKFDHQLAMRVRNGTKTATWRIYDDKNIAVNDILELVDKVDPQNPGSWVVIGQARVERIIEKRLGDIVASDYEGHEAFASPEAMLEQYQAYYGPEVNLGTPIKMIHFSLQSSESEPATHEVHKTTTIREIKLYTDGGSRGNPGPSASGFAIMDMENEIIFEKGVYLGVTTNNQAEYQALRLGLEEAFKRNAQVVHVYMDSMLVVNQMRGIFKVKNRDLWPVHDAIRQLVSRFKQVSFTHVPRELNKIADRQVNDALDTHINQNNEHNNKTD